MTKHIILLHGWGANASRLQQLQQSLKECGWEVWAPDLPGFGQTPAPAQAWSLNDYVNWVRQGVAERGWTEFSILGHSFGGSIAIKLASLDPVRRGDLQGLERLVLVAPSGIRQPGSLEKRVIRVVTKLGKWTVMQPGLRQFANPVRSLWYRILRTPDYHRAQGLMRPTLTNILAEDLTEILPRIKIPTLLLWGEKDTMVPVADGHLMNRLIPNSQLKIFPGQGHNFIYQPNDAVMKGITEFLDGDNDPGLAEY